MFSYSASLTFMLLLCIAWLIFHNTHNFLHINEKYDCHRQTPFRTFSMVSSKNISFSSKQIRKKSLNRSNGIYKFTTLGLSSAFAESLFKFYSNIWIETLDSMCFPHYMQIILFTKNITLFVEYTNPTLWYVELKVL